MTLSTTDSLVLLTVGLCVLVLASCVTSVHLFSVFEKCPLKRRRQTKLPFCHATIKGFLRTPAVCNKPFYGCVTTDVCLYVFHGYLCRGYM